MIDWLVLFAVFAAPQFAIMAISGTWFLDEDSSPVLQWAWVGMSVTLPSYLYFVLSDRSSDGQTLGKRTMNLAARSDVATRMSWVQALVRNAVKLLPWEATHIMIFFPEPFGDVPSGGKVALMVIANGLMITWLLAPLVDRPHFRALHDRVSDTRVAPI